MSVCWSKVEKSKLMIFQWIQYYFLFIAFSLIYVNIWNQRKCFEESEKQKKKPKRNIGWREEMTNQKKIMKNTLIFDTHIIKSISKRRKNEREKKTMPIIGDCDNTEHWTRHATIDGSILKVDYFDLPTNQQQNHLHKHIHNILYYLICSDISAPTLIILFNIFVFLLSFDRYICLCLRFPSVADYEIWYTRYILVAH